MTLQTIQSSLTFDCIPRVLSLNPGYANILIDVAGEEAWGVFQAPKTGNISKIGFRTVNVATGDTVDVRLETVTASTGFPSSTLVDTNSNADQIILAGDDNAWFTVTLDDVAAVVKGDIIAIVIVNGSVPGNINIAKTNTSSIGRFPYAGTSVGPATVVNQMNFVVGYDDGTFPDIGTEGPRGSSLNGNEVFNSTDTPERRGNIFQFPFPTTVTGFTCSIDLNNAGANDMEVILFDNDGISELLNFSPGNDIQFVGNNPGNFKYTFSSTANLAKDTTYRLVLKPGTADQEISFYTVDDAAHLESWPGGENMHATTWNGSAWTETTNKRFQIYPVLNAFGDDTGGAGGGGMPIVGGGGIVA